MIFMLILLNGKEVELLENELESMNSPSQLANLALDPSLLSFTCTTPTFRNGTALCRWYILCHSIPSQFYEQCCRGCQQVAP